MSFANTNLVTISNGNNNNNNVIATSNGDSFIAAISSNQGPFTGAKYFKGATPGTIKKPSAGVASMKTTGTIKKPSAGVAGMKTTVGLASFR